MFRLLKHSLSPLKNNIGGPTGGDIQGSKVVVADVQRQDDGRFAHSKSTNGGPLP